jgi:hypothetical protein
MLIENAEAFSALHLESSQHLQSQLPASGSEVTQPRPRSSERVVVDAEEKRSRCAAAVLIGRCSAQHPQLRPACGAWRDEKVKGTSGAADLRDVRAFR